MKAIFVDEHTLKYAPNDFVDYNNTRYAPPTDEVLAALGYKDVVYTDAPEAEKDHHVEMYYVEKKKTIEQAWKIVEDSSAMICANLRNWFDNKYRKYNEMLTRYAALGISESIVDDYREKTYTNLSELYAEAEVVRKTILELENKQ